MSGTVVGQGHFRVDRRKALDKLERFQLEDPHRYVLELLAAAVCAGAEAVDIVNDSDDFEIAWSMPDPISGMELDTLFDHVFTPAATPRSQMLSHLAVGVLAAHSLSPKWLTIEAGDGQTGVRLDLRDPAVTKHAPSATPVNGVRVRLREQMSTAVISEALRLAWQPPVETRLVQGCAEHYPLPTTVNGVALPSFSEPTAALRIRDVRDAPGSLWWIPSSAGTIAIRRHGLVVAHTAITVGHTSFTGVIDADDLSLNASRSGVVDDPRYKALLVALERLADDVIRSDVEPHDDATLLVWRSISPDGRELLHRASIREVFEANAYAVIRRLQDRKVALGRWNRVPILKDLHARSWTVEALSKLTEPPGWSVDEAPEIAQSSPVFAEEHAAMLKRFRPDAQDVTTRLRQHAAGRRRRLIAEANRLQPDFGSDPHQRRFEIGAARGAITADPNSGHSREMTVSLRIAGAVVESITIRSGVGPASAILDHPEFVADPPFLKIVRDQIFQQAIETLHIASRDWAVWILKRGARGSQFDRMLMLERLTVAIDGESRRRNCEPATLMRDQHWALADVPCIVASGTDRITARQVFQGQSTRRAPTDGPWWVVAQTPPHTSKEDLARVLQFPASLAGMWLRWLGDERAVDGTEKLQARAERTRRLSKPRIKPSLSNTRWQTPFSAEGILGVVGIRDSGPPSVHLLRDGVAVCDLPIDTALTTFCASLDIPDLAVNDAHDDLAPGTRNAIRKRLLGAVATAGLGWWQKRHESGQMADRELLTWVASKPAGLLKPAADLRIAMSFGGHPWTLRYLLKVAEVKRGRKLAVLDEAPDGVAGFERAVEQTPELKLLLDAWVPHRWRNRTADLVKARAKAREFTKRPTYSPPRKVLATSDLSGRGWTGTLYLPADEDKAGVMHVVALYLNRVIASRQMIREVGGLLVVSGEAFRPNTNYSEVTDPKALSRLIFFARDGFADLLEAALPALARTENHPTARAIRLRWARHGNQSQQPVALKARFDALPLFRRPDGSAASLTDLAAITASGVSLSRVPDSAPVGPVDNPGRVYDDSYVVQLLDEVLNVEAPLGGDALRAWRREQHRRHAVAPRGLTLIETPAARAEVKVRGARGEVGVYGPEMDVGLVVIGLVDERPLSPVVVPFPVRARAVLTGDAIEPDDDYEYPRQSAAFKRVVETVSRQAEALVAHQAKLVASEPEWRRWVVTAALATSGGPLWTVPFLADAAGNRLSLHDLERRDQIDGEVAWVTTEQGAPPGTLPSPIVLGLGPSHWGIEELVDWVDLKARLRDGPAARRCAPLIKITLKPPLSGELSVPRSGETDIVVGHAGHSFWRPWLSDLFVPLVGSVQSSELSPNGVWLKPRDAQQEGAFRSAIREVSRQALLQLTELHSREPRRGDRVPALLRAGLRRLCHPPNEAKRFKHDPETALMRSLPIWPDRRNRLHSTDTLFAQDPLYFTGEGPALARPNDAPPVFEITQEEREWLAGFNKVKDATTLLDDERVGREHRARLPFDTTPSPWAMSTGEPFELPDNGQGQLWLLSAGGGGGVTVVVNDRRVQVLEGPFAGVSGWIRGDFPVNARFDHATLGEAHNAAITRAAHDLAQHEARTSLGRFAERVQADMGDESLREWVMRDPVLSQITVFRGTNQEPVSLADVARPAKKPLFWCELSFPAPEIDVQVLRLTPWARHWIESLPGARPLVHAQTRLDEVAFKRDASTRKAQDRQRRKNEQILRETLVARGWTRKPDALNDALDAALKDVPVAAFEDPVFVERLAVWTAATALRGDPDELVVIEGVARALKGLL